MDMEIWYEESIVSNSRDWPMLTRRAGDVAGEGFAKNERFPGEREVF